MVFISLVGLLECEADEVDGDRDQHQEQAEADRVEVKAASLYWHVRDRSELLELVAESILGTVVRPRPSAGWRQNAMAIGSSLQRRISAQKDATRILLEVPDALERSDTYADLKAQMQTAGLQASEAGDVAL